MTGVPGVAYQAFQNLQPFRVQDILLVSSLYDAFTLQEDGRLNELILGEFLELSLHHTPGLTHVASGAEALRLAQAERRFNLIITAPRPGDMDAVQLAREVRRAGLDVPVVVLAFDNNERKDFIARHDLSDIERVFLWQGTARILVAIVKSVEDRRNAAHDTRLVGVPVVLVVEDNIRYYSSFLPVIYTEMIGQSQRLISEGLNLSHKLVRMRARPKILLATTFEEAWALFDEYRPYLLGMISDVEFPRGGELSREAGFDLARMARAEVPDLPILLQSSRAEFAAGDERFLKLSREGSTFIIDNATPSARLGRDKSNDVVVTSHFASRFHARIHKRGGGFFLTDQSSNGTYLLADDGAAEVLLQREEAVLGERGWIGLGMSASRHGDHVVRYRIEREGG